MKIRLLRKCRAQILLVNNMLLPARQEDKKIMVVKTHGIFGSMFSPIANSKGGKYYGKLGNAENKQREEIVKLARELSSKSWLYNVFH